MMGVLRPDRHLRALLDSDLGFGQPDELNAATHNGISVLDRAAKGGFANHIYSLLAFRADLEIQRKDNGFTPLLSAAEAAYPDCCRVLLKGRADVNARGLDGCTALHVAAKPLTLIGNSTPGAKLAVLRDLIQHHADPNLRNDAGK